MWIFEKIDSLTVKSDESKKELELHLCQRSELIGKGDIVQDFLTDYSYDCIVNQITAGDIILSTKYNINYNLKFFPINIPGTDQRSSLYGSSVIESTDESRNESKENESKKESQEAEAVINQ